MMLITRQGTGARHNVRCIPLMSQHLTLVLVFAFDTKGVQSSLMASSKAKIDDEGTLRNALNVILAMSEIAVATLSPTE